MIIVLPLLLLASIIFPIIYLIGRTREDFRYISTFVIVISLVIVLIYRTYGTLVSIAGSTPTGVEWYIVILVFVLCILVLFFYALAVGLINDEIAKYWRE